MGPYQTNSCIHRWMLGEPNMQTVLIDVIDRSGEGKSLHYHLQGATLDSLQLIRDSEGKLTERLSLTFTELDWAKENKPGEREKTPYQKKAY